MPHGYQSYFGRWLVSSLLALLPILLLLLLTDPAYSSRRNRRTAAIPGPGTVPRPGRGHEAAGRLLHPSSRQSSRAHICRHASWSPGVTSDKLLHLLGLRSLLCQPRLHSKQMWPCCVTAVTTHSSFLAFHMSHQLSHRPAKHPGNSRSGSPRYLPSRPSTIHWWQKTPHLGQLLVQPPNQPPLPTPCSSLTTPLGDLANPEPPGPSILGSRLPGASVPVLCPIWSSSPGIITTLLPLASPNPEGERDGASTQLRRHTGAL